MKTLMQLKRKTKVSRLREVRGTLPQWKVAEALGIQQSHLSQLEAGRRTPSMALARQMAAFYGTTIEDLFPSEKK